MKLPKLHIENINQWCSVKKPRWSIPIQVAKAKPMKDWDKLCKHCMRALNDYLKYTVE